MKSGGLKLLDVCFGEDTALTHSRDVGWHLFAELNGGFKRDFKCIQISIIYANDFRSGIDSLLEFFGVVNFHHGRQAKAGRHFAEVAQLCGSKDGSNQEDCIGVMRSSFENLYWIDGEIFSDDGEGGVGACSLEIPLRTLKELPIGQDRQTSGPARFVLLRD